MHEVEPNFVFQKIYFAVPRLEDVVPRRTYVHWYPLLAGRYHWHVACSDLRIPQYLLKQKLKLSMCLINCNETYGRVEMWSHENMVDTVKYADCITWTLTSNRLSQSQSQSHRWRGVNWFPRQSATELSWLIGCNLRPQEIRSAAAQLVPSLSNGSYNRSHFLRVGYTLVQMTFPWSVFKWP
jgi:hypothetical protein